MVKALIDAALPRKIGGRKISVIRWFMVLTTGMVVFGIQYGVDPIGLSAIIAAQASGVLTFMYGNHMEHKHS
ncbi:MAG: hypothetical protein GY720_22275, partial [bacterium]|nr:hypothetical protein [bacterium]